MFDVTYPREGGPEAVECLDALFEALKHHFRDLPPWARERIRDALRWEVSNESMLAFARGRMSYRDFYRYREALEDRGWISIVSKRMNGRKRKVWDWNPDLLLLENLP